MKKHRKIMLSERLDQDEGAWLKTAGEFGDLCRLVLQLQTRLIAVESTIAKLLKGKQTDVGKKSA
jgi:hypothetical protein